MIRWPGKQDAAQVLRGVERLFVSFAVTDTRNVWISVRDGFIDRQLVSQQGSRAEGRGQSLSAARGGPVIGTYRNVVADQDNQAEHTLDTTKFVHQRPSPRTFECAIELT